MRLHRWAKYRKALPILCLILLFCVIGGNAILNSRYFVTGFLDYDAAAELMLGKTMAENNEWILSNHWYYSTEIRVLHNQLVLAPLFRLLANPLQVQILAAVLLDSFLAACVVFCFCSFGMPLWQGLLAACAMLTPYSPIVFNNLHAACYYNFFLGNMFLFIALLHRLCRAARGRGKTPLAVGISLFSFILGLCGIRYALLIFLPLLLLYGLRTLVSGDRLIQTGPPVQARTLLRQQPYNRLAWVLLFTALYGTGFVFYTKVLTRVYPVMNLNGYLIFSSPKGMVASPSAIAASALSVLAPTFEHGILSFQGLLPLLRLGYLVVVLASLVYLLYTRKTLAAATRSYLETICSVFFVNMLVLVITRDIFQQRSDVVTDRYVMLAVLPLMTIPILLLRNVKVGHIKRTLVAAITVCVLFVNFINLNYIAAVNPSLTGTNANQNIEIAPIVTQLVEDGYTVGYSTTYYNGVINVLSGFEIDCIDVNITSTGLEFKQWLQSGTLLDLDTTGRSCFIFLDNAGYQDARPIVDALPIIIQTDNFTVFEVAENSHFLP